MVISKAECKDWARSHFRGFENILMPSFTPDFGALDEEGIRLDVRRSIEHGVFSVFAVPLALSPQETARFLKVVCDEARGRCAVGIPLIEPTRELGMQLLETAAAAGVTHVLIHPWHELRFDSEEALYRHYREFIDASPLAFVLWATDGRQFQNLHPGNVAVNVCERLTELPNVVAMKLMTTLDLPTVYELCERVHRKTLIGTVHLGLLPFMVKNFGTTWSGAWTIEALQSPEQPLVVEYLDHLLGGRTDAAMKAFWRIKPGYDALFQLMGPMLPKGVHPFTHLKYYQWCMGGNGGLLREPMDPAEREFPLRPNERQAIRNAYRSIGITATDADDSAFVTGRAAHRRGVTPDALTMTPTYTR